MEKLLFATANTIDKQLKHLSTEYSTIRDNALGGVNKFIEISPEPQITFLALKDKIQGKTDYTFLHYSGHSNESGLVVNNNGNLTDITKKEISNILKTCPNLRLVFLNSCCSEKIAKDILSETEISYVIGTNSKIGDELAAVFAFVFYENLGKPNTTIDLAFKLTKAQLEKGKDEFYQTLKKIKNDISDEGKTEIEQSRSLGPAGNNGLLWEIYENPKDSFLNKNKDWTLIPKANLVLCNELNKDKIKILCLYEQSSSKVYDEIKTLITNTNIEELSRVQNGLFAINSDNFDIQFFQKEYQSANFILHLLTGATYENLINSSGINTIIEANEKTHICLPLSGIDEIFTSKNWFKKSEILKPKMDFLGNKLEEIRINRAKMNPLITFSEVFNDFFKEDFEQKITSRINPKTVKSAIKNIPFLQVIDRFSNTNNSKLFYTLIESSPNCAELLLINHVKRFKNIKENISVVRIPFKSSEIKLINDSKEFWKKLFEDLKINDVFANDSNYSQKIIENILNRIQTDNLFIVLEGLEDNELFENQIINLFWNNLKTIYNVFKDNLLKQDSKKEIKGKLFLFIINNNNSNVQLKQITEKKDFYSEISVSPVDPFTEDDYNLWDERNDISINNFAELSPDCTPISRMKAITEVCKLTNCNFILQNIDKEILSL